MRASYSVENTCDELAAAKLDTALLVYGGAEQCGSCLPCCLDTLVANFLADVYADALGAFRTPVLPFNTSQEHGDTHGTLSLSAALIATITRELVLQLKRKGFRRFVILSPHGGSHWEQATLKELNAEFPEITVISAKDGAPAAMQEARAAAGLEQARGMHGGAVPLCTTAFLRPDLVRFGSYGSFHPEQSEMAFNYGLLEALAEDGCWGDPVTVTPENLPTWEVTGKTLWTTFAELQAENVKAVLERVDAHRRALAARQ